MVLVCQDNYLEIIILKSRTVLRTSRRPWRRVKKFMDRFSGLPGKVIREQIQPLSVQEIKI